MRISQPIFLYWVLRAFVPLVWVPSVWLPPIWVPCLCIPGLGTYSLPFLCNYQRPVVASCKEFKGLLLLPHLDLPSTTFYLERNLAG